MTPLTWLIAALVLLIVEVLTPGLFFFACLGVGALAAALGAWLGLSSNMNWGIFFGVSALLVFTVAPLARKYLKRLPTSPVGLDSLKGQRAYVVEAIDPTTGQGQVRLETGALWRALSDTPHAEGTWVVVQAVTGTRLRVKSLS